MSQPPLLTESPEKAKQRTERREPHPNSTRSFQGGSNPILQLQRTLGNQRVAQLIKTKRLRPDGKIIGLQSKLTVGAADDQYEQEADRVARQVVSMPDSVAMASFQQALPVEGEASQTQTLQSKPLPLAASITPFVQRQMGADEAIEEEKDQEEDKEELPRAKFFNKSAALPLQRQLASEEEKTEPVQAKLSLQRDISPAEKDEDQVLQTKQLVTSSPPVVQRQTQNDEESEDRGAMIQAKFLTGTYSSPMQRQSATEKEEPETLQVKSAVSLSDSFEAGETVESRLSQSKGSGSQLPDNVRTYMEPRFGVDFGHVRVHTGSNAIQMNRNIGAQAFTHGSDIYYGAGSSPTNLELTAHELTHVVQQTGGTNLKPTISQSSDGHEREKDEVTPATIHDEQRVNEQSDVRQRQVRSAQSSITAQRVQQVVPDFGVSNISSRLSHIQRWESALPEPELIFDANADDSITQIENDVTDFISGPLTDHKVRTGTICSDLTEQGQKARDQIAAGEIAIPGSSRSQEESEGNEEPETEFNEGAPEIIPGFVPQEEEVLDPGEQIRQLTAEERSQAHEAQSQHAPLPHSAEPTAPTGEESESNEAEVRTRLNSIDVESSVAIERPETPEPDLSGVADPAQIEGYSSESELRTTILSDQSSAETERDRGEGEIGPDHALEDIEFDWSQFEISEPEQSGADIYQEALASAGLTSEQADFTQDVNVVSDRLQDGAGDLEDRSKQLREDYSSQLTDLQSDSQGHVDEALVEARQRESSVHQDAEAQVETARAQWRTERDVALEQHRVQANQRISLAEEQIGAERERFDQEANLAIDEAVSEAEAETERAEEQADAERGRAEREGEEGGFWSWVGSALDSVIEGIVSVISAIFDSLNWLIDKIFKGLEWVIEKLVEGIRLVVIGIIEGVQGALDLLGDALEALFGEQARQWIDTINGFLDDAIDVLNDIVDWVRDALVGILEMINQGLQAIVTLIKWAAIVNTMLMTGLWVRYLWLAIEHFDRLWNNIMGSFDGLLDTMIERSDEAAQEFWRNLLTPANLLMLAVGLIIAIVGAFVGISEVVAIILIIVAILYLATVAVELGNRFMEYGELIWSDDVAGAREKLADTLLWLAFNIPLILLAIFGIRGGLRALRGRATGGAGEGGRTTGEGGEGGRTAGEGGERTTGEELTPVPGEEPRPVPREEPTPVPGEEPTPVPGEEPRRVPGEERPPEEEPVEPAPPGNSIPLDKVRYSQRTISNTTSEGQTIDQVAEQMRTNGWDYSRKQPDMIDWNDGEYQTLDHRRLEAARRAELDRVGADVHPSNEPIPADQAARFRLRRSFTDPETGVSYRRGQLPVTWGEAAMFRSANQGADFPIRGSRTPPTVTGGGEE